MGLFSPSVGFAAGFCDSEGCELCGMDVVAVVNCCGACPGFSEGSSVCGKTCCRAC